MKKPYFQTRSPQRSFSTILEGDSKSGEARKTALNFQQLEAGLESPLSPFSPLALLPTTIMPPFLVLAGLSDDFVGKTFPLRFLLLLRRILAIKNGRLDLIFAKAGGVVTDCVLAKLAMCTYKSRKVIS